VEAEPMHVRYLEDAFWEMGVPDEDLEVVCLCVSEREREMERERERDH
jgi:hypothetical protein